MSNVFTIAKKKSGACICVAESLVCACVCVIASLFLSGHRDNLRQALANLIILNCIYSKSFIEE